MKTFSRRIAVLMVIIAPLLVFRPIEATRLRLRDSWQWRVLFLAFLCDDPPRRYRAVELELERP